MSENEPTPITRLGLRRVELWELLRSDEVLRACPLVRTMPDSIVEGLLAGAVVRRFADGAHLLTQGAHLEAVLLIIRGEAALVCGRPSEQLEFAVARKGDVVAEAALLAQHGPVPYGVVAKGEVDVAEVDRARLLELARRDRPLVEYLRALDAQRRAAREEMTSFLGRW